MEDILKHCKGCDTTKPTSEFNKDKHQNDGYTHKCKLCRREQQRLWRLENKDKVKLINERKKPKRDEYYRDPERKLKYRKAAIEKSFNIHYHYYEELELKQKGLCAICNNTQRDSRYKYLCVDHCHKTGVIRGLLCGPCNRALGHLLEDSSIVLNAYNYLLQHEQ